MQRKNTVKGVFNGNLETYTGVMEMFQDMQGAMRSLFETYTRYARINDKEKQKFKAFLMVVLKLIMDVMGDFRKIKSHKL